MPHINIISPSKAEFLGKEIPLAIGKNGFCPISEKIEGDHKTPLVNLKPMALYYRCDRVPLIETFLPTYSIHENDGWCDDPQHPDYNQFITFPFNHSAEKLYRQDHCYDYILVTDYNYPKAEPYKGSAIFIHLMHDDKRPTAGCLAFEKEDLQLIIQNLTPNDYFELI